MVNDFPHFRTLLNKCIKRFKINDNLTLNKLLGKGARLLGDNGEALEKELIDSINAGKYIKLCLGDVEPHSDPKRPSV